MNTKEDAYAAGEQFKKFLLELALTYKDAMPKLDGSENRRLQTEHIDKVIETVQNQIRTATDDTLPALDPESRRERGFEGEYKRLWGRVMELYFEDRKNSDPTVASLLTSSVYSSIAGDFIDGLYKEVQDITIPILERHASPGDDLYLFVLACMRSLDKEATVESLGKSEKTPPQLSEAFFGMFGLLMQARKAEREQDMIRATSYLFDVNHLIGLHEGACYPMRHLPAVVKKLHARHNAKMSHVEKKQAKVRTVELYYALRPSDAEGRPTAWNSAEEAMKSVWDALVKAAISEGRKNPVIKDSTVQKVCDLLHRQDKKGKGYDIRVEVIQRLPDGTEIKIPL
jgi:hypothetical protein